MEDIDADTEHFEALLSDDDSGDLPLSNNRPKKPDGKNNQPQEEKKRSQKPLPFDPNFLSNPKNYSCITIDKELIVKEGAGPEFSIVESYEASTTITRATCTTSRILLWIKYATLPKQWLYPNVQN
jgi:hypothetical protein